MNTVNVTASRSYEIKIGSGLLNNIGQEALALGQAEKVCIVSDSNVFSLYGKQTKDSLKHAGFDVEEFIIPAGEASKNTENFIALLNALARMHMTRTDLIVALGGGVVGDLAGFAAACYLRGIRFIQVPTTLLAAVDSSVGGKTAIDLPAGKNLAGAFWQPSLVICDVDTLSTLPVEVFRDGCAEVIKYAVLYDEILLDALMCSGMEFDRIFVITRCITWKRNVVKDDEFDAGSRMKLNLGHTLGHSVEMLSDYTISHGQAVSIGMAMIARAAVKSGFSSIRCCQRILEVLNRFQLPTETDYSSSEIYAAALSDKKRRGSSIRLIIPREIGNCEIKAVPIDELKSIIEAGL